MPKDDGRKKASRDAGRKLSKGARKYQKATKCSVGPAQPNGPVYNVVVTPIKPTFVRKNRQQQSKEIAQPKSQHSSSGNTGKKSKRGAQQWVANVLKFGLRDLRKTFVEDVKPYVPSGSKQEFALDKNFEKNRYDDVELLDKTRVKLKNSPDGDDYIHASFVEISSEMLVICAQGPLEGTIQQFWIMVVEQSCKVVLQLCQYVEDGKEKSCPYFPSAEEGNEKQYGSVKVRVVGRTMGVGAMKAMERTLLEVTFGSTVVETTHLLFSGWPDHSVPDSLSTYISMRDLIRRLSDKRPIVAHCSAGIGRSGTYTAIEMAYCELMSKRDRGFSMLELIRRLRDQRSQAVQNDQQYVFIHRMLLEILLIEGVIEKTDSLRQFIKDYDELIKRKKADIAKLKKRV